MKRLTSLRALPVALLLLAVAAGCGEKSERSHHWENYARGFEIARLEKRVANLECLLNEPKPNVSFAQQRLDALLDHAAAFSKITAVYFRHARPDVDPFGDWEVGAEMDAALAAAREVINRNAILFDLDFNKDADWYFEIFHQINHLPVTEWAGYRIWIADLTNYFDDVCKERIRRLEGETAKDVRLPLSPIPYKERIGMGAVEYLDKQRTFWERTEK